MSVALIILAAGKGTRMNSDLPKVLHPIGGAPMLHHAMRAGSALAPAHTVVVAGYGADAVRRAALAFDDEAAVVVQEEQLGTAHAAAQARQALAGFEGRAIVLFGDTPFVRPETLEALRDASADISVLGFEAADPARYGRLVMEGDQLQRIVEFKDASEAERAITLCNSGVLAAPAPLLFDLIGEVNKDNAQGEYYLTDLPRLARARGMDVAVVRCAEAETLGINSRAELAGAEAQFQAAARAALLEDGVTLAAPDTVVLSLDTNIGRDTLIEPNVVFGPGVSVESGATIRAFRIWKGATCRVARSWAPMPGCAPARNWPKTCAWAISSRSRTQPSRPAPRSTTSATSGMPPSARAATSGRVRSPAIMTA